MQYFLSLFLAILIVIISGWPWSTLKVWLIMYAIAFCVIWWYIDVKGIYLIQRSRIDLMWYFSNVCPLSKCISENVHRICTLTRVIRTPRRQYQLIDDEPSLDFTHLNFFWIWNQFLADLQLYFCSSSSLSSLSHRLPL